MRLRNRFLLVGAGIIIFAVVTPALILYARGFTYDFQTHKIVKTGTLVVRTEPNKAQVFLNGKLQSGKTPLNVRFLLPGDYSINIQKDGYSPWTKRLGIRSQFVTWATQGPDFVALFLANPNLISTTNSVQPAETVVDEKQKITDLLEGQQIPVPVFTDGKIIEGKNQIYLLLDQTLYRVNGTLEKIYAPVTDASFEADADLLLYSNNNEIYLYDPNAAKSELILRSITQLSKPQLNWKTGFVFFVNDNKIKAVELDGRDQRNVDNILDLGANFQNFQVADKGDKLTVYETDTTKLYAIQ